MRGEDGTLSREESLASTSSAATSYHDDDRRQRTPDLHATATAVIPLPEQQQQQHAASVVGGGREEDGLRSYASSTRGSGTTTTSTSTSLLRTSASSSDDRMSANPAQEVVAHILTTATTTTSDTNIYSYFPEDIASTSPSTRTLESYGRAASLRFNMDGTLPENDGMHSLRQKLQEVKQLAVSTEEKAKRMHFLMTQDYMKHRALLSPPPSQDGRSYGEKEVRASPAIPIDPANPYSLRPGDTDAVFSPLPKNTRDLEEGVEDEIMNDDIPDLGCMHYKRNVKVQCFDCQRWFPCRHCHDQAKDLPFPHSLNRKKTQNMLCMLCETPQPAAEVCINCGQYAAYYFCPKCKLWDNDSNKRIYHCDDCGICRVGEGLGKDYVHCRRCNVCISISTSAAHPCIERATEGNCPLCLVQLFESRTSVVSLPCGHYMHGDCYKDLMAVTYKCPVCSKSAVNMELQWKKLDDEIATQPMPDEDEDLDGILPHVEGHPGPNEAPTTNGGPRPRRPKQVWVGCNDCGGRCWTTFHWLGLKCRKCDSYNTNQMAPTLIHETEAERLMRQQTTIHRHDFSGNAVLRDAGIGADDATADQIANSALEVPESPSQQHPSPRLASGAQSPGRYFVHDEPPRRPSFNTARFSAPSMPNLPTLSDLPRMPNLPTLPNLQHMRDNMRQNLPNMPNVELPRFSPYEMIDSLSRSLSPMQYYLRGLDRGEDGDERPMSVHSDPTRKGVGSKLGSALWDDLDERDLSPEEEDGEAMDEDEDEEESDEEMVETETEAESEVEVQDGGKGERRRHLDLELIGHR